jgi:hypothetical protein
MSPTCHQTLGMTSTSTAPNTKSHCKENEE